MDIANLLQLILLVLLTALVGMFILILFQPDGLGALRCVLRIHEWSAWGDPHIGKKTVGYDMEKARTLQTDVMIQEQICLRCRVVRYRKA